MNIGLGKHGIPYADIHDMFEETTPEIGPSVIGVFLIDHLIIFGIAEVYEKGLDEEVVVIGGHGRRFGFVFDEFRISDFNFLRNMNST